MSLFHSPLHWERTRQIASPHPANNSSSVAAACSSAWGHIQGALRGQPGTEGHLSPSRAAPSAPERENCIYTSFTPPASAHPSPCLAVQGCHSQSPVALAECQLCRGRSWPCVLPAAPSRCESQPGQLCWVREPAPGTALACSHPASAALPPKPQLLVPSE